MIFQYPGIAVDTDGKEFKQRAAAIQKALGATGYEIQPVPVYSWAPDSLPSVPKVYGIILFQGLVSTLTIGGTLAIDVLGLLQFPARALQDMVKYGGVIVNFNPDTWEFIDPDDAVSPEQDPIGDPWPTHWNAVRNNRKMYKTGPAFNLRDYPVGTLDKPQRITRPHNGVFDLFQWWVGESTNLSGATVVGRMEYAWEKVQDLSK